MSKEKNRSPVRALILASLVTGILTTASEVHALNGLGHANTKPRWTIDETRWFTLGAGFRGSGVWAENPETGNFHNTFRIDNARVFLNGQIHRYIKAIPTVFFAITPIRTTIPGCPITSWPR